MSVRATAKRAPAVSAADLDRLHAAHELRNPDEIMSYLAEHQELVPLLIEGRRQINHFFAEGVPVSLSLDTDPEEGDQGLYVRILSGMTAELSDERLARMWHQWWFKQKPKLPSQLFFDAL